MLKICTPSILCALGSLWKKLAVGNDALWSIITQSLVVMAFLPMVGVFCGIKAMESFFLGGLVCILPNSYLYLRVFSHFGARRAKQIVRALYIGEGVKVILTALCFIGALCMVWTSPLWLLIGYIIAQSGLLLLPLVRRGK